MNSYRRDSGDPRSLLSNQEITEQHLDSLYDEGDIFPGSGALFGTAALQYTVSGAPVIAFPDAATTSWEMQIPVRRLWGRRVGLEARILYTGSAGSTNNSTVFFAGFGVGIGSVQGAIADAFAVAIALPGPAVAQTVQEYVARTPGKLFTPASLYIVSRLVRAGADAADTYAGELHVLAVHWRVFGQ